MISFLNKAPLRKNKTNSTVIRAKMFLKSYILTKLSPRKTEASKLTQTHGL